MIVVDETMSGQRVNTFTVDSLTERLTVRAIIRARIWQEVLEYNASKRAAVFKGLVQPTETEARMNGPKESRPFKSIDWEKQYETALRAFESNGFFLLISDRQAQSLDEEFVIAPETEVSFVKLVPLVGG